MVNKKLFSSDIKAQLAGHAANYQHNRERATKLALYGRQAAEHEWNICDLFLTVARSAATPADLQEICRRIKESLKTAVEPRGDSFEDNKADLVAWIQKRKVKASTTARRLRKTD